MKFQCKEGIPEHLTAGKLYDGQVVMRSEPRNGNQASWDHYVNIVVYNDSGYWVAYAPGYFEPAAD